MPCSSNAVAVTGPFLMAIMGSNHNHLRGFHEVRESNDMEVKWRSEMREVGLIGLDKSKA
jgi:hypothetical protein